MGFIVLNVVVTGERERIEDFPLHLSLALISSPLWHPSFSPLPPSLLMSLSVTSPSLLLPLFLAVYLVPRGSVVLFFCRSSGHKAKESPRQPSVYKAFCHVNKDKLFLSLLLPRSQISTLLFTFLLEGQSASRQSVSFAASSVCTHLCACERVWTGSQKVLLPPRNNWFNKLPAMFHSQEVTGAKRGDGARRLIRKQSHLYGN